LLPKPKKQRYERERSIEVKSLLPTDQTKNTLVDAGPTSLEDSHFESENSSGNVNQCSKDTLHRVFVSSGVPDMDISLSDCANGRGPLVGSPNLSIFPSVGTNSNSSVAVQSSGKQNSDSLKSGRTTVNAKSDISLTMDNPSLTSRTFVETGESTAGVFAGPAGIASSSPKDFTGEAQVRLVNTIELNHERPTQLHGTKYPISESDHSSEPSTPLSEVCDRVDDNDEKKSNIASSGIIHPNRSWLGQSNVERMSNEEKDLIIMSARLRAKPKWHNKRRIRQQHNRML